MQGLLQLQAVALEAPAPWICFGVSGLRGLGFRVQGPRAGSGVLMRVLGFASEWVLLGSA